MKSFYIFISFCSSNTSTKLFRVRSGRIWWYSFSIKIWWRWYFELERFDVDIPTEIEGPHGITVGPNGDYWYLSLAHGNPLEID